MNKGPPIIAVIIPIGNSTLLIKTREIKSAQIMNKAPDTAVIGRVTLWSLPNKARTICGMIKPTKPIIPEFATINPVIKAVKDIYNLLYLTRETPSVIAASSPKSMTFSILDWVVKKINTARIGRITIPNLDQLADARLPINQN